ncbi:fungal-specific transcription factor domain-containing protein [Aspergillus californicus]
MSLPKKTQEREVSLLMHYVDDVFPHQFPFYHSQFVGKREWLLPLLSSTKSVYYATLCLSLLHKENCFNRDQPGSGSFCQEERLRYYILALRETQQLLPQLSPECDLETVRYCVPSLASALYLISYECACPTSGDWRGHLQAATSLIPFLVQSWNSMVKPSIKHTSSLWTSLDLADFYDLHTEESLSYENTSALRFLANALAVTGILSFISTGPTSALSDYRYLMDAPQEMIQCDQFLGCENWVMSAILEVGLLDRWKREEEDNRRLSFRELANRAKRVEDCLETGIRVLSVKASDSADAVNTITRIYASSSLTYLHSVVSGLNPDLDEIRDSVSRTIEYLKQLSNWHLLASLTWPLCVTGCLAAPDQEAFFHSLVVSAELSPQSVRNKWTALEIMKGMWKARCSLPGQSMPTWEQVLCIDGSPRLLV